MAGTRIGFAPYTLRDSHCIRAMHCAHGADKPIQISEGRLGQVSQCCMVANSLQDCVDLTATYASSVCRKLWFASSFSMMYTELWLTA